MCSYSSVVSPRLLRCAVLTYSETHAQWSSWQRVETERELVVATAVAAATVKAAMPVVAVLAEQDTVKDAVVITLNGMLLVVKLVDKAMQCTSLTLEPMWLICKVHLVSPLRPLQST